MEQKIVDFRVKPPTLEFRALYDPEFFQSLRVEGYIKSGMLKFPELTSIEVFIDVLKENGIAKAAISCQRYRIHTRFQNTERRRCKGHQ